MSHVSRISKDLGPTVAAVVPCYRSANSIGDVVNRTPECVDVIVCVNDASDDHMEAALIACQEKDVRVRIVTHEKNGGVGAATISGYCEALKHGADIVVKLDSDGQMNPAFIPNLIAPIVEGEADYTKGNRFFDLGGLSSMPKKRLIGNAGLSFITKLATGYWSLFDPTNGFTAIHGRVLRVIPLEKLHKRYFFESDLLFRLSTIRARIVELPMRAVYADEISNLSEIRTLTTFPWLHTCNFFKRICYNYILRGFSAASLSLISALPLLAFGLGFGLFEWSQSAATGVPATTGTVMLSVLPSLIGVQLLLNFLQNDVSSEPKQAVHTRLREVTLMSETAKPEKFPLAG